MLVQTVVRNLPLRLFAKDKDRHGIFCSYGLLNWNEWGCLLFITHFLPQANILLLQQFVVDLLIFPQKKSGP